MARYRTLDQITISMLDFARLVQPEADVKPGTVVRDLMIDMPANEIAKLYNDFRTAAGFKNIFSLAGVELDQYARNYGITRKTGTVAAGQVVVTTSNLDFNITIPAGTVISTRGGLTMITTVDATMLAAKPSLYRSVATRLSTDLQLAGITDEYALEIAARAGAAGISGNFGKYTARNIDIAGINSVTNIVEFSGGAGAETDAAFRSRILAIWAGANLGSAQAYLSAVEGDPRVVSARVVEPGDVEMTRDGTIVSTDPDGNEFILSPGTGGKVDVVIQGDDLQSISESYIYSDRSGTGNAADPLNDFIIGQRGTNSDLDLAQRRKAALDSGTIPYQPVRSIVSVSGSMSGPNFVEGTNYELETDTGAHAGSPFGRDRLRWLTSTVTATGEQVPKIQFNSIDALDYSNVTNIDAAWANVQISREVATVESDRQYLQLKHSPVVSVDRAVNYTTGERYRLVSVNPDGGDINTTGRIQISGATLPRSTDIVEVSYIWRDVFDRYSDFDNIEVQNRVRTAGDSVDWGYQNRVLLEPSTVLYSAEDGYHVLLEQPISRVTNVYTYSQDSVVVASGKIVLAEAITSLLSVVDSGGRELYYTAAADGSVGGSTITFPTDSAAQNGTTVVATYNITDIYSPDGSDTGSFSLNKILLADFDELGAQLLVDYVVDIDTLLPTTSVSSLPAVGSENEFAVDGSLTGDQPSYFTWSGGSRDTGRRITPTNLAIQFSNLPGPGRLQITGLISEQISSTFTCTSSGSTLELADAIRTAIGSLPSGVTVWRVAELQRVSADGTTEHTYDLLNYRLRDPAWDSGAILDTSISATAVGLASTADNLLNEFSSGQQMRATFYVQYSGTERLQAVASGTQYSENRYLYISDIRVDSGFRNLSGALAGELAIFPFSQPDTSTQFTADYTYVGPKSGERITLQFEYNRLIGDCLTLLEAARPIGADVLPRAATRVEVSVDVDITPFSTFTDTAGLRQTVIDRISQLIRQSTANGVLDASDVVGECYTVNGVDRVILTRLNTADGTGVRRSIALGKDEYFVPGSVTVELVSR